METIQINGQKIWGPPKGWVGPPPPYGTEIFIKNIPDDVFEDELYYLFSSVGMVYEVRLPVHWNGMNKGYAFVRFTKVTEADGAIKKLNFYAIRQGRQIRVERSLDNTRLFLSSVPNDRTGEQIKSELLTVVENVKTVYVYPAMENPAMFRGYAFVEFEGHRDAAIAKRILTPDVLYNLFERKCIAAWANPLPFLNTETLRSINVLFMRNVPSHIKIVPIRIAVNSLISPDSVHKVKKLNDYAFLTFKNHDMAERAMMKIKCNPFLLGVKAVHVEWAIPRELANSFSSKDLDFEKDDESEMNFESNIASCQSLLKILENQRSNHPEFSFEELMNAKNDVDVENIENVPFGWLPNARNVRILQRPISKSDSLSVLRPAETHQQHSLNQHNQNNSSEISALMLEGLFNRQNPPYGSNSPENQSFITEFRHQGSEESYRDMHLMNWLQSLALSDQYASCATSPALSSPSTGSSTNASWKWDETFHQLSGFEGKSSTTKATYSTSQQVQNFR